MKRLSVSLSDDEMAALEKRLDGSNLSKASYARYAILSALELEPEAPLTPGEEWRKARGL